METTTATEGTPKSNGAPAPGIGSGIAHEFQQAVAQAVRFASIQIDLVRLRVARAIGFALLLLAGALFGLVILAVSAFYLLQGLAGAFSHFTGGAPWVGYLLSGVTGLAAIGIFSWLAFWRVERLALLRSMAKYGRGIQQPEQRNQGEPRPRVGDQFSSTGSSRGANAVGRMDAPGASAHRASA